MNTPLSQLNLPLGIRLRDIGLDAVEDHNLTWVERMRIVAKNICDKQVTVSADDLRQYVVSHQDFPDHPNAWGSIFREKGWKMIGRKKSEAPSAHAREIKVWTWTGR